MTLGQVTIGQISIGHVVNLASNDVQRFDLVRSINSKVNHLLVFNNCLTFILFSCLSGFSSCSLHLDCSPSPDSLHIPCVHRGWVECISSCCFCAATNPTANMPCKTVCKSQVTSVCLSHMLHLHKLHQFPPVVLSYLPLLLSSPCTFSSLLPSLSHYFISQV